MWQMSRCWGLPLERQKLVDACYDCDACAQENPQRQRLPWVTEQITQGKVSLTRWNMDYIGPLPKACNVMYAFTAVGTAMGLKFASPSPHADQRRTVVAPT